MNNCPTCSAVEIEVVLDRSGSMMMLAGDAIGGYNTWLASQQALPGAANLTLTLFDHEFLVQPTVALANAAPLSPETYVPRGNTALNDAIGRALSRLESKNPRRAILVILTDGFENASREFSSAQIKSRIEAAQRRDWQVVYLSADINGFDTGTKQYGVRSMSTVQMAATGEGLRGGLVSATAMNTSYRSDPAPMQQVDPGWFAPSAPTTSSDCGATDSSSDTSTCDASSF